MKCPCANAHCTASSYREHIASMRFGKANLPRGEAITKTNREDRQLERDLPAYKALRQQGYQPKTIDGVAEVASRAKEAVEITDMRLASNPTELSVRKAAFENRGEVV